MCTFFVQKAHISHYLCTLNVTRIPICCTILKYISIIFTYSLLYDSIHPVNVNINLYANAQKYLRKSKKTFLDKYLLQ